LSLPPLVCFAREVKLRWHELSVGEFGSPQAPEAVGEWEPPAAPSARSPNSHPARRPHDQAGTTRRTPSEAV